jgi:hypothetical protein
MATYTTPRTPGTPRQAPGRGTGPRRGTAPNPGPPPDLGTPPGTVDPRRTARPGPKDPRTRPVSAPRHTRPLTGPGTSPTAKPAKPVNSAKPAKLASRPALRPAMGRIRPRRPRAPFILLLVGLLGGALVCLLVISTTLAEGSYRITNLQQQDANLAKQEQLLTQQVAQASSPTQIAQEAEQLGMQPDPGLQFINLKTGKIVTGKVSTADAEINVPGYTP